MKKPPYLCSRNQKTNTPKGKRKSNNIKIQSNMKQFHYIWVNGVRLRVTAETLKQYEEEERQERIRKMNRQDHEKRNEYIQKYQSNEADNNR